MDQSIPERPSPCPSHSPTFSPQYLIVKIVLLLNPSVLRDEVTVANHLLNNQTWILSLLVLIGYCCLDLLASHLYPFLSPAITNTIISLTLTFMTFFSSLHGTPSGYCSVCVSSFIATGYQRCSSASTRLAAKTKEKKTSDLFKAVQRICLSVHRLLVSTFRYISSIFFICLLLV